mgnify:CR=1 FL=1
MTGISRRKAIFASAAICAASAVPGPAMANGDVFFEALEIEGDPQFVYYGRVIQDLGYEIDPSQIDISVFAPGYKTVSKFSMRRSRDTVGAFEVNFVLEEDPSVTSPG